MKIEFFEHDAGYAVNLTAENLQDAAFIARMTRNAAQRRISLWGTVGQDGTFQGGIDIGKRADWTSSLGRK